MLMMGVVLSLIVVACGVIEALSCYHHFQIGLLRGDPNVPEYSRRSSLFTSFRRKKKKAVVYAPPVGEERRQWTPEERRRLKRVAMSLELHLLQLQQQHLQLQLQIAKIPEKTDKQAIVDGFFAKPKPVRSISLPERQTPARDEITKILDSLVENTGDASHEFNEIYEETKRELRQQKQLIEKRPSITDIAITLENAALNGPIKIDTFADEIVERQNVDKFASAGQFSEATSYDEALFTKPLVELDNKSIHSQVTTDYKANNDKRRCDNEFQVDGSPEDLGHQIAVKENCLISSPVKETLCAVISQVENTSNVLGGDADSGISNHSAKTQIDAHQFESDIDVFNFGQSDGFKEAVMLKDMEIIPKSTCDRQDLSIGIESEDKLSSELDQSLVVDGEENFEKNVLEKVISEPFVVGGNVYASHHEEKIVDIPEPEKRTDTDYSVSNGHRSLDDKVLLVIETNAHASKDVVSPVVVSDVLLAADSNQIGPKLVNEYETTLALDKRRENSGVQDVPTPLENSNIETVTTSLGADLKIIREISDAEIDKCVPVDEPESTRSAAFSRNVTDNSTISIVKSPSLEPSASETGGSTKEPFWVSLQTYPLECYQMKWRFSLCLLPSRVSVSIFLIPAKENFLCNVCFSLSA